MKKKLTVNDLALGNLKARKKQYAIMITGILLAMVFSSGMLFFASSMLSSMKEYGKNTIGAQDGILYNAVEKDVTDAYEQGIIDKYGFAHIIGSGYFEEENRCFSICWLDDAAKEISYISFLEGGYPENEGEIAVEKAVIPKLGKDVKIGDKITLQVKSRNDKTYSDNAVQKEYTLVGIARNKLSNGDTFTGGGDEIPSAFVCQGTSTDIGGKESLTCYINYDTNARDDNGNSTLFEFFSKRMHGGDGLPEWIFRSIDDGKLNFLYSSNDNFFYAAFIFAFIFFLASAIAIVNSFNSNLKDRKKQIGMLKTVGATSKDIINIFGREAFIISLICTPLSLLISFGAVKLIISLLGEDYVFIPNIPVLILCGIFSLSCVMLAAIIPLLSASRISPMQAIRNISITRKMKGRKIKSQKSFKPDRLLAKRSLMFTRVSQCAVCIVMIVTIIASIYGFSFIKYQVEETNYNGDYYDYIISSVCYENNIYNYPEMRVGYTENEMYEISTHPYVRDTNGYKYCNAVIRTPEFNDYMKTLLCYSNNNVYEDNFTQEYYDSNYSLELPNEENIDKYFFSDYTDFYKNEVIAKNNFDTEVFPTAINAYNAELFKELEKNVTDGKIDINKLNSGEEIVLVAAEKIAFFDDGDSYGILSNEQIDNSNAQYIKSAECPYKAGDVIDISVLTSDRDPFSDEGDKNSFTTSRLDRTVKIGAIVNNISDGMIWVGQNSFYGSDTMFILTTVSGMEKFNKDSYYTSITARLNTKPTSEIDKEMQEFFTSYTNLNDGYYASTFERQSDDKNTNMITFAVILGMLIIFLSISASIINNSLTARIREEKRVMGTLRAVGAGQRDIVLSYIRQLLSMLGWGSAIGFSGFGLSYLAIYLVHIYKQKKLSSMGYTYPLEFKVTLLPTIIACLLLFAVCAINLWLKVRKEMKNSIIDNIREL